MGNVIEKTEKKSQNRVKKFITVGLLFRDNNFLLTLEMSFISLSSDRDYFV